jgi:hypothetical protein
MDILFDFISGIDRYSKMKPYRQEVSKDSPTKENIGMGMVIGRRPGLVRYIAQTGLANQFTGSGSPPGAVLYYAAL